ncbi:lactonase family protein [Rathayibacter sp. KR2-224]|uniref:lactonase family protein n=1 Tax=Rathayibacter sp. KR2-224 TaxID=3400913 RepID=UPI003C0468ED
MKTLARIGAAAAAAAVLVGAGATAANAATPTPAFGQHQSGAVFAQTDNLAGNTIVAYDRLADGTLREAGTYATGGLGGQLTGSVVDHTASQGALDNDNGTLIAVNAGSNTITTFGIAGDRLYKKQTLSSGGAFPVSVTSHGNQVYVLNARNGGSIQGYLNLGGFLVPLPNSNRGLGLNPAQTPEFTSTPGEVSFTPDGSKVIVSTKNGSNAFDVFDSRGVFGLSPRPVVTTVAGTVPFGFAFDARGNVVATEAGPSAVATFAVNRDDTLTQISQQLTGQAATCWIVADGTHFYASNAGSGTLSAFTDDGTGQLTAGAITAAEPGTVDATVTADGRYLYAQTGAAGDIDEYAVAPDGTLTKIGAVTVPGAIGGEGIVVG